MDSNLLKVFVEVAKEKSITKAAIKLNFAQSNVTSRIKQLEKSLSCELFHRIPKGVILSKEGEKLYPPACEIVRKVEQVTFDMKNINEQEHLIVGSTESNATTRIVPFLLKLHKDFPKTNLELITNIPTDIRQNLYLIFKEAITNTAKHSNGNHVDVTLEKSGNVFIMRIMDNGKVIAKNYKTTGLGISNIKMRAKQIDAQISFSIKDGYEIILKCKSF